MHRNIFSKRDMSLSHVPSKGWKESNKEPPPKMICTHEWHHLAKYWWMKLYFQGHFKTLELELMWMPQKICNLTFQKSLLSRLFLLKESYLWTLERMNLIRVLRGNHIVFFVCKVEYNARPFDHTKNTLALPKFLSCTYICIPPEHVTASAYIPELIRNT